MLEKRKDNMRFNAEIFDHLRYESNGQLDNIVKYIRYATMWHFPDIK